MNYSKSKMNSFSICNQLEAWCATMHLRIVPLKQIWFNTPGIITPDIGESKICYKKAKASSYIAQYPVLRIVQSALHFTSLTDLFTQTPSQLLWEASSHMLQLMREGCSYTYPPLSLARYSFIQLSELEQCRVEKNLPKVLTQQHRIRTRVLGVESPKLYP